ncbi:uncharacterized protein BXZ73DRAFT_81807 [Epithele typhae]|uniref:uncharacterized protein n=1 Tax=Epithele typhae TaxID=378194 RepID=UPI0020080670|nr:uncharacterized protein BXZ73DRAFT_81807 [Epithele typhae]KAH9913892.1 hypothetical protein BXZ73DRAFT_81807 [Epithele typhae]
METYPPPSPPSTQPNIPTLDAEELLCHYDVKTEGGGVIDNANAWQVLAPISADGSARGGDSVACSPDVDPKIANISASGRFTNPEYRGPSTTTFSPSHIPISCLWSNRADDTRWTRPTGTGTSPLVVILHGACHTNRGFLHALKDAQLIKFSIVNLFKFDDDPPTLLPRGAEILPLDDVLERNPNCGPIPPPLRCAFALYLRNDIGDKLAHTLLARTHIPVDDLLSFSVYPPPNPEPYADSWKIFTILGIDSLKNGPSYNEVMRVRHAIRLELIQRLQNDHLFVEVATASLTMHSAPNTLHDFMDAIHLQPVATDRTGDRTSYALLLMAPPIAPSVHDRLSLVLAMRKAICSEKDRHTTLAGFDLTFYEDLGPHPAIHCCICASDIHITSLCPIANQEGWTGYPLTHSQATLHGTVEEEAEKQARSAPPGWYDY